MTRAILWGCATLAGGDVLVALTLPGAVWERKFITAVVLGVGACLLWISVSRVELRLSLRQGGQDH